MFLAGAMMEEIGIIIGIITRRMMIGIIIGIIIRIIIRIMMIGIITGIITVLRCISDRT